MKLNESCYYKTNLPHLASETAKKLYYYVQWTGHFICKKDFYIQRANLESYLLLYTIKGSGHLNYMNTTFELKEKSIVFIDCTKPHEYFPVENNWDFKFIHFLGTETKKYYEYITELHNSPVIYGADGFEWYFDKIYGFVDSSEGEERCSDIIYRLLTKIISAGSKTTDNFKINDILYYISENYANNITVQELADISHLSRCYFSTIFKNYTGFSPYEYILNFKIHIAKQLLYNTTYSIEKIGSKCGFLDTSSFIRAFKRQEGISPLLYRKRGNIHPVSRVSRGRVSRGRFC